jgi:hypothetical protein
VSLSISRVIGEALASSKWQIWGTIMDMMWLVPAHFTVPMHGQRDREIPPETASPVDLPAASGQ